MKVSVTHSVLVTYQNNTFLMLEMLKNIFKRLFEVCDFGEHSVRYQFQKLAFKASIAAAFSWDGQAKKQFVLQITL